MKLCEENLSERRLGGCHRPRSPRATQNRFENILRLFDRIRARAERQHLSGLPGSARRAACAQPRGGENGGQGGARAESQDQSRIDLRAEKLFLSRSAEGIS